MDDITQKFLDRLKDLVALGKKKKSILDVQEINDFFNDMELNACLLYTSPSPRD